MTRKRILITGGASWVRLDAIRILTNVFTGNTAVFLSKEFSGKGHSVTLLINPARAKGLGALKNATIIPYRWFDEFVGKISRLLRSKRFDCVIHSAALADFCPERVFCGKMASRKHWILRLKPTPKVLPLIRRLCKGKVVQFKLEVGANKKALIESAYKSLKENRTDFVIANSYRTGMSSGIRGYLIDRQKRVIPIVSQRAMSGIIEKYVLKGAD